MTHTLLARAATPPKAAPQFQARFGLMPMFPSSHDAVQYERGYQEFPATPPGLLFTESGNATPRCDGYLDAKSLHDHDAAEAACDAATSNKHERVTDADSCLQCDGTGEGQYSDTACTFCRGRGQ